MNFKSSKFPDLGFGVGLRHRHFQNFLKGDYGSVEWVEALTENYLPWEDGRLRCPFSTLMKIRENLPVVLHGVSLSIGSVDPVDEGYVKRLKDLAERVQPVWLSDHLCWTGVAGENLHDLLPLPYTEEAIANTVEKISTVQDRLGRRILIENVSSYAEFQHSKMPEWEFVSEIANRADCGILLDVNNVYVSAVNHDFDPYDYLRGIPWERVGQLHLAGHTNRGTHCIDTHDEPVCDGVWDLYRWVTEHAGPVSTLLERDDNIPPLPELILELEKARAISVSRNSRKKSAEKEAPDDARRAPAAV